MRVIYLVVQNHLTERMEIMTSENRYPIFLANANRNTMEETRQAMYV
jgi:hypothetical protein